VADQVNGSANPVDDRRDVLELALDGVVGGGDFDPHGDILR
jgi:hypothetical protein